MKRELINRVWINLIKLSAYEFEEKNQKLFVDYACTILQTLISRSRPTEFTLTDSNAEFDSRYVSNIDRYFNQLNIFKFALISFYYKYKFMMWIVPISFILSLLFIKLNDLLYMIIGLCIFIIFITLFLIYGMKFAVWYSLIDGALSSAKRLFNDINRRINDFDDINEENANEIIKTVLQNIVTLRIDKMSDDWRLIAFYSPIFAVVMSGLCWWIVSLDGLIEVTKLAASIFKLEDFEIIKNLSREVVLGYLFVGFTFLSGFTFSLSSRQTKAKLIYSRNQIENRSSF